jgi:hypothetical protein
MTMATRTKRWPTKRKKKLQQFRPLVDDAVQQGPGLGRALEDQGLEALQDSLMADEEEEEEDELDDDEFEEEYDDDDDTSFKVRRSGSGLVWMQAVKSLVALLRTLNDVSSSSSYSSSNSDRDRALVEPHRRQGDGTVEVRSQLCRRR